jgi:two-component system, response regulator YesN
MNNSAERTAAIAIKRPGINAEQTRELRRRFAERFALPVELTDAHGVAAESTPREQPLCALLARNAKACARCRAEHRRAMQTAFEIGEPYSFACHAGLLVVCVPLADGPVRLGALFSGMTLPEPGKAMGEEIARRVSAFHLDEAQLRKAVKAHPTVPVGELQRAGETLFQLATEVFKLDSSFLRERRERAQQLAQVAQTLQAVKSAAPSGAPPYSYEREKDLIEKVKVGDRYGAKGVLNEILGVMLFREPMGSPVVKTRLFELLALISRAAAEAGVAVDKVLEKNLAYFGQILGSNADADWCVTISKALNEFLDTVCISRETQAETPVTAVLRHIEQNYAEPLSVEELAHQAHLSPSRLAHVFSATQGLSLIEAVTRVRLRHAKRLLLESNLSCTEIAFRVGYNEQSYFTRVFRQREKVTPRQFRVLNRAPAPLPAREKKGP